jgi:hypothetical protein
LASGHFTRSVARHDSGLHSALQPETNSRPRNSLRRLNCDQGGSITVDCQSLWTISFGLAQLPRTNSAARTYRQRSFQDMQPNLTLPTDIPEKPPTTENSKQRFPSISRTISQEKLEIIARLTVITRVEHRRLAVKRPCCTRLHALSSRLGPRRSAGDGICCGVRAQGCMAASLPQVTYRFPGL